MDELNRLMKSNLAVGIINSELNVNGESSELYFSVAAGLEQLPKILNLLKGNRIMSTQFQNYLKEDGIWLPIGIGLSPQVSLERLSDKIPYKNIYSEDQVKKINAAYDKVIELTNVHYVDYRDELYEALENGCKELFE